MSDVLRQGEAIAPRAFGPFPASAVAAYAAASADTNPLHSDAALATRAGLARPPIHGMLIMGCFEDYLRAWRATTGVRKLSAKFIRPVLVDEGIAISGKVVQAAAAAGPIVLRLTVKRHAEGVPADLVCIAEAVVDP